MKTNCPTIPGPGAYQFKGELILMLQVAGFREITVRGDYTDQPATADSVELVLTAIKEAQAEYSAKDMPLHMVYCLLIMLQVVDP